jgi:serine/threonine-protein kinase
MLIASIARRTDLAVLEADGETSLASFLRGTEVVAELGVAGDVGSAAAARLAAIAGLDPLAELSSLDAATNVARIRVRSGSSVAEVLVSVGATRRGLVAEVRALTVNGRAPAPQPSGQLKRCTRCDALQAASLDACERDGAPLVEVEDAAEVGGTIGAYRVLGALGQGAGGAVFAGEHAVLGRPVAIKVLHRDLAKNPDLARRFLAEARAASRLRHPSVVEVTDFGVLRSGHPYMVMERLSGEALDIRLARDGALDPAAALRIAREIAFALGAAHDAGIAHNDLKPSNVVMLEGSTDEAPSLKLIDFGAASVVGTAEELLYGTPGYMAPERILGTPSDGRADLYALGMVLYEMLSGAAPFGGLTQQALLLIHLREPLPPLASPRAVLPLAVLRLVTRAVAKRAEQRYQDAAEMIADLDRALVSLSHAGARRWLP